MSRDGNGNYSLPAGNPVSGGTTIDPNWANTTLNDIAAALTGSVSSDGQTTMTGNLKMNGNTLTGLASATARTNPPTAGQVQDSSLTLLTSVSGTDTITATISPAISSYTAGQVFHFISVGANSTTTVTMNINGLGAKNVLRSGGGALAANDIKSGQVVELYYNGTYLEYINSSHSALSDLATKASAIVRIATGQPLPSSDIGLIWHADYADVMSWQSFTANGAAYTGYATRSVGRLIPDSQPTARTGFTKTGVMSLSKTGQGEALWNWALHNSVVVDVGSWAVGMWAFADNGDGTFRCPDVRGYFGRLFSDGSSVDSGRAFTAKQAAYAGYNTFQFVADDGDSQVAGFQSITAAYVNGTQVANNGTGGPINVPTNPGDTRPLNFAQLGSIVL